MSIYPTMFQPAPTTGDRQFLVQINSYGEVVVYQLDGEGKAAGFATCKTLEEMLLHLARTRYPDAQVQLHPRDEYLVWSLTRVHYDTFAEVAAEINRRPIRADGRRLRDVFGHRLHPVHKYVQWCWRTKTAVVTPAGLAYDQEFYPPKPDTSPLPSGQPTASS